MAAETAAEMRSWPWSSDARWWAGDGNTQQTRGERPGCHGLAMMQLVCFVCSTGPTGLSSSGARRAQSSLFESVFQLPLLASSSHDHMFLRQRCDTYDEVEVLAGCTRISQKVASQKTETPASACLSLVILSRPALQSFISLQSGQRPMLASACCFASRIAMADEGN